MHGCHKWQNRRFGSYFLDLPPRVLSEETFAPVWPKTRTNEPFPVNGTSGTKEKVSKQEIEGLFPRR